MKRYACRVIRDKEWREYDLGVHESLEEARKYAHEAHGPWNVTAVYEKTPVRV